ncbi:YqcI/YcgG family protein [Amycolatopsis silviterrae]|uniref:YqcI/YcgG family protein n=1 Tax=Amycolatopsis silviterrae TaxID=1656914 RepID=A0ABW5HNG3_9PSEU
MHRLLESRSTTLTTQQEAETAATGWRAAAFRDVESRLTDSGFPCVFSRNAFKKRLLLFAFADDAGPDGVARLGAALADYVELSRNWNGHLDTAYPLLIVFSPDAVSAGSVAEYQAFGWEVIQKLHHVDPRPWPEDVGTDPGEISWSMCFNGMPLFFNMSSPAHEVRRSRNLGGHFVLVVNPRERFDAVAGDTPSGRKVRSNIRARIDRYDRAPRARQLGSYGVAGLEWWQYGLPEEDVDRTDQCPFSFRAPETAQPDGAVAPT